MQNELYSLSEKCFTDINGVKQGMFITSTDATNPVLLFVHGGPGMPEYFLEKKFPTGLESLFTVCYWEQRGAGISYSPNMAPEGITVDQLIDDTISVTKYLCERFGQQKIYLMAHSWGSYIGIQAAEKAPELFHAYIGIGQIAQMFESERIAYAYILEEYQKRGDRKMVRKLQSYAVLESDEAVLAFFPTLLRDQAMHKMGIGTMRRMTSIITGVFIPVLCCRAYSLRERIAIWQAKAFLRSKTGLIHHFFTADLMSKAIRLDMPCYFMSGRYDYTVNAELSKKLLDMIDAPKKAFYMFEQSAHSPMFEEPERFTEILAQDIMKKVAASANML